MIDYKRLDNESNEELIYRICSSKDRIGSWQDVANILNDLLGTEYTESKFRKQFQAFQKMLNANQSKIIDNDNYIQQIKKEKEEIRKERIKLQTANIERNRLDRNESRQQFYYEYVGSVIEALPNPEFKPLFDYTENDININYLVCLSDLHYGATFKSENNEYSPEIAKERFEHLSACVIEFIQKHKINKIHIVSLGDLIQGILRVSDLKINDSSIVKATVEISRLIALFIREISTYALVEYYHTPSANHTQIRPLGTKASEIADEDLEYIIGNYIKDLCATNDRINVHLSEEGKGHAYPACLSRLTR